MRKVLVRVVAMGVGVALAALCCELFVRAWRPQPLLAGRDGLPAAARVPVRSYRSVTSEWDNRVEINTLGFHDVDHPVEAAAEVLRVWIAGDSFSHAAQVPIEQTWWHLAGAQLGERCGREVEVLNGGMENTGTALEWATYDLVGRRFDPDVVLVPFCVENDVLDNGHALQGRPAEGLFFEVTDGQLRQVGGAHDEPLDPPLPWRASHLLRFLGRTLYVRAEGQRWIERGGGYPVDLQLYLRETDADWALAWDTTEGLLRRLQTRATENGATLLATLIPRKTHVHPDDWQALLEHYPAMAAQDWDLDGPHRRLADILDRQGIPRLDLLPALRAAAEADPARLYHRADIHWTPRGHEVVAEATASFVEPWICPPAAAAPDAADRDVPSPGGGVDVQPERSPAAR